MANIRLVRGLGDALRMRAIRNTCREFMTYDTSHIGIVRQVRWFRTIYAARRRDGTLYGYLLWQEGEALGYGLVTAAEGRWWVTGGLLPEARGEGLGKSLFSFLTFAALVRAQKAAVGGVWLNVFATNERARRLYESLGYKYVPGGTDDILWMRYGGE